jgi:hypothetical protein
MIGVRVGKHDRSWPQTINATSPVESTVDHHFAPAVADEQRAVSAMPARSRLDLAPRPEKAKPHAARSGAAADVLVRRTRTSPASVSETSPARDEPRHRVTTATSVAKARAAVAVESRSIRASSRNG